MKNENIPDEIPSIININIVFIVSIYSLIKILLELKSKPSLVKERNQ